MNHLHIKIDFGNSQQGNLCFLLSGYTDAELTFNWDLLTKPPDIELLDFTGNIHDTKQFALPSGEFELNYCIRTDLHVCVGSHRDIYLNYPFANENEVFISAGTLPVPVTEFEGDITIELINLPEDWRAFSNLEPMHSAKLESFFIYASRASEIWEVAHQFEQGHLLKMRLQVQHNKTIPFTKDEFFPFIHKWLDFLETSLAPYTKTAHLNMLILQAPANFRKLVSVSTFATGENIMNGIVCYAPQDGDYLEKLFGYRDYGYFLIEGIVHELAHLYASSGDAASKSILYAAPDCPRHDRLLIGESLPGYIHRLYMFTYYHGDTQKFFTTEVLHWVKQLVARPRANLLFKWLLLDIHLQTTHQSAVLALFGEMVRTQQVLATPFHSQEIIQTNLKENLGIEIDSDFRRLLAEDFAGDVLELLRDALPNIGLALTEQDGQYNIVGNLTTFKLG